MTESELPTSKIYRKSWERCTAMQTAARSCSGKLVSLPAIFWSL